jgi:hypothetical protein
MLGRYIGDFCDDMKHGEGVFHYADGSRWVAWAFLWGGLKARGGLSSLVTG